MTTLLAFETAFALVAGVALGVAHFASLRRVTEFFAEGRALAAAGLQALRLLVLGAALVGAAWLGAWPLLAAMAGILLGRWAVLRRERLAP